MKRYPIVIGVTVAGLAGVLTFHSHSQRFSIPRDTSTHAGSTSHQHTPGQAGHAPSTTLPGGASTQGAVTTSATGSLEEYGYGQLSVRVTMSGGKIIAVSVATLRTEDTYSQQLANQVIPVLQREVLSAQTAQIDGLSGATYTSEAYAYSAQSAIDKLRS